jgi:alkylation response protein AidB-like acyl-CoA dehydrogenase
MDFSFSEEQEAVRELADRIFTDLSTQERLREMETDPDGDRFDRKLWSELAGAGLLGISLPEEVGGAGLDFLETGLLAEAAGRTAAYVPVVECLAAAAPAVARFGTEAQRQQWLPGVVAGDTVLTTALVELGGTPAAPPTRSSSPHASSRTASRCSSSRCRSTASPWSSRRRTTGSPRGS